SSRDARSWGIVVVGRQMLRVLVRLRTRVRDRVVVFPRLMRMRWGGRVGRHRLAVHGLVARSHGHFSSGFGSGSPSCQCGGRPGFGSSAGFSPGFGCGCGPCGSFSGVFSIVVSFRVVRAGIRITSGFFRKCPRFFELCGMGPSPAQRLDVESVLAEPAGGLADLAAGLPEDGLEHRQLLLRVGLLIGVRGDQVLELGAHLLPLRLADDESFPLRVRRLALLRRGRPRRRAGPAHRVSGGAPFSAGAAPGVESVMPNLASSSRSGSRVTYSVSIGFSARPHAPPAFLIVIGCPNSSSFGGTLSLTPGIIPLIFWGIVFPSRLAGAPICSM